MIPGQGTKIPQATWYGQKKEKIVMFIASQNYSQLVFPNFGRAVRVSMLTLSLTLNLSSEIPSSDPNPIEEPSSHLLSTDYVLCVCVSCSNGPALCDPMNYSPPSSSIHGISQARILEWVAISFSRGSSQPRD